MTGNMLGRLPVPRYDGRSGLGRPDTVVACPYPCPIQSSTTATPETGNPHRHGGFCMARPGLEPGTPRFSVVGLNLSNSDGIPAIPHVLAPGSRGLDTRKLRSFLVDL